MSVKRSLRTGDYQATPYLAWNEFVSLLSSLALEENTDASTIQKDGALIFRYDSEVQNGGHLQFFENCGADVALDTIIALKHLGALRHSAVLERAAELWTSRTRPRISTPEQYSEVAMTGEFDAFDAEYHACEPSLIDILEKLLETNFEEFINLV